MRSFTIVKLINKKGSKKNKDTKRNIRGGRYMSEGPMGAASKVFSKVCRESRIKGRCTFVIVIQETTAGSSKKIYKYKGKRMLLKKPVVLVKDGNKVQFKYHNKMTSLN